MMDKKTNQGVEIPGRVAAAIIGSVAVIAFIIAIKAIYFEEPEKKSGNPNRINYEISWAKGGSLHNASINEWKSASYSNKLATAADWLAATSLKGKLNSPSDFKKAKSLAGGLVSSVDYAVSVEGMGGVSVAEIAAMIITNEQISN